MRDEFKKVTKEMEQKDAWFRDALSQKTTIDTALETWSVTKGVAKKLYDLVLAHKPMNIIEVGMSQGYSAIWLAEAANSYGGIVHTIEIEESKIKPAQKNFDRLGFQKTIQIIHGNALDILKQWQQPIDFLFLDAVKREYFLCLQAVEFLIPQGGIVVADDVIEWRRKLGEFFAYVEKTGTYSGEIQEIGHGLYIAHKNL
jgi:predicted O-methyltransferase YrrM